jgi:spermidine/putrescine transport system permease protein
VPAGLKKAGLPYLLLLPGLGWLLIFFAIPLGYMAFESLKTGTIDTGFVFDWSFSNYSDAISQFDEQFLRSFEYAGIATVLGLVIGYPLAYVIAFRGGRWRNALLLAVIVPFFVTYLIRTLSWETILSDSGAVVSVLQSIGILADDGRLLDTTASVVLGITYNFLPFMILPLYASLERIDPRLLEAGYDLYGRRSS